MVSGTKTRGRSIVDVPWKPSGATPTIVIGAPFTVSVLLTTAGSRPNCSGPEVVGQNDHIMPGRNAIVVEREEAAKRRRQCQRREIAAGHEDAVRVDGLAAIREIGREVPLCPDAVEDGLFTLEVAEQRVAEHRLGPPLSPAERLPGFGPGETQNNDVSGEVTGSRRSSRRSKTEKIAVLTPMPSASDNTATVVSSGRRQVSEARSGDLES